MLSAGKVQCVFKSLCVLHSLAGIETRATGREVRGMGGDGMGQLVRDLEIQKGACITSLSLPHVLQSCLAAYVSNIPRVLDCTFNDVFIIY